MRFADRIQSLTGEIARKYRFSQPGVLDLVYSSTFQHIFVFRFRQTSGDSRACRDAIFFFFDLDFLEINDLIFAFRTRRLHIIIFEEAAIFRKGAFAAFRSLRLAELAAVRNEQHVQFVLDLVIQCGVHDVINVIGRLFQPGPT